MMRNIFAVGLLAAMTIFYWADVFLPASPSPGTSVGMHGGVAFNDVSGTHAWLINTISALFSKCVSAAGVFTKIHSEVHYQFHVCVSQFVDSLKTCRVVFTENRKPVVFLFVPGSVDSSSNISASKGLVLSGTLSVIHPNCFSRLNQLSFRTFRGLLQRTNVTSFSRFFHCSLVLLKQRQFQRPYVARIL